jgi:hypothetical protein
MNRVIQSLCITLTTTSGAISAAGEYERSKLVKQVTEFVIDRSKWLRGEGGELSRLLRKSDQKQCCVGMYLTACGVPFENIEEVSVGSELWDMWKDMGFKEEDFPDWLKEELEDQWDTIDGRERLVRPKSDSFRLYTENDTPHTTEEERELFIAAMFAKYGVKVTFIN